MARNRQRITRRRLERRVGIPQGLKPKIDLAERLVRNIVNGYRHFKANKMHWRDKPAQKRLERTRQTLALVLQKIKEQDPEQAGRIEQSIKTQLEEIIQ